MKQEEILRKIKDIVESKTALNLSESTTLVENKDKLSKFIAEIAYDCFIEGYNAAIDKVNEDVVK